MPRLMTAVVLATLVATGRDLTQIRVVGTRFAHEVKAGETLTSIGARYGVSVGALVALNHLADPNSIDNGAMLTIDNRHLAIISSDRALSINIAQRMLYRVAGGEVAAYPIAVGRRSWPTPTGAFTVVAKETNPTWDVPPSIREEMRRLGQVVVTRMDPSPKNPLGTHWIGLSIASLGIHGTIAPASIYQFASHGCIRLHPDDVAELFEQMSLGDAGELFYEPVMIAAIDRRVWLEAHADVYRLSGDSAERIRRDAADGGFADRIDWVKAATVLQQRLGIAVEVTREAS